MIAFTLKNISFMQAVEILGVIFSLLYVILASFKNSWCWLFGIIGSGIGIYIFFISRLYAESILFFYYILAGFYGWYSWQKKNEVFKVKRIYVAQNIQYVIGGSIGSIMLFLVLSKYTNAIVPMADSFVTIFSFIATWLTIKKIIDNWIYWIIIDLASIGLYLNRGLYYFAILSFIYTVVAVYGYYKWNKALGKKETT
jgi:nicotinamide mononucleotide transporter